MSEIVEAEVVEPGQDLAPVEAPAGGLFKADSPADVLARATEVADALAPMLREKGLISKIGQGEHVRVEGWLTLGQMLSVTPVNVWTRELEKGWEARVEARTLDGRVIGAAEAMCLRDEANWKDSDEFAIRSMAQTRATSKALASVLRFVVTLAGFSGTPAEEMVGQGSAKSSGGHSTQPASDKQIGFLVGTGGRAGLFEKAKLTGEQAEAIIFWKSGSTELSKSAASELISTLKDNPEKGGAQLLNDLYEDTSENAVKARAAIPVDAADTEGLE